jgi:DNA-binding response OmpR family regulator
MLRRAFERAGYRAEAVETGEDALSALLRFDPAVAVLDVRLPGPIQGLDICRHIRAALHRADMVVVFVTASSQEGDARLGIALGADAYLRKPVSPRVLIEEVADLLANRADQPASVT